MTSISPLSRKFAQNRNGSTRAEELTGTIYLPSGRLHIDPNATVAA